MRPLLTNEAELQAREQQFAFRQHSYELTQKLTYFVISVELVFCGYMLLNADKLNSIHGASYLFLACGIAALLGIFWRFFYNQTYHNHAHGIQGRLHKVASFLQIICYWIYVVLSIVAFVWTLIAGFNYLDAFGKSSMPNTSAQHNTLAKPTSLAAQIKEPQTQAEPARTPGATLPKDNVTPPLR